METNLIIISAIFLVFGFLVGVKKMTWLLAGFNEKRVTDKTKLSRLVGSTMAILGAVLLVCGLVGVANPDYFIMASIGIILLQIIYVNMKLVE
ncbi:DUF3784 domain-containing protein [Solibacillus sp. CAU 1738]|uniref:DUF3784 domain-containing protein n=1 Tax=Solibacillus sp. CAU 1738 TaxID=3140363 RepID=UPI00325FFB5D